MCWDKKSCSYEYCNTAKEALKTKDARIKQLEAEKKALVEAIRSGIIDCRAFSCYGHERNLERVLASENNKEKKNDDLSRT